MSASRRPGLFTVPAGTPFLNALVKAVLEGRMFNELTTSAQAESLTNWTILLPTRRAVRACREAFLAADGSTARLLPNIRALGDTDEDEINITGSWGPSGTAELALKPAASDLQRQFLMSKIVQDWARKEPAGLAAQSLIDSTFHALQMARSLLQLIDSLETGEITLAELPERLASDDDMPRHRSEALDFLSIIVREYPAALESAGIMGPQARRSALLSLEADRLRKNPPTAPIIAAGSTGSIPATSRLLATIAHLPLGAVVLPGLDQALDDESWNKISEQHPQFGMKELLAAMQAEREDVALLPGVTVSESAAARSRLALEAMRPSETTGKWRELAGLHETFQKATQGITELVCPETREQASMIAMVMRKTLDENRPCSLITPDRQLARRVSSELLRWNIHVDDSAGEPLSGLAPGIFFRLVSDVCAPDARPHHIVALLGHILTSNELLLDQKTLPLARKLEIALLRQMHGAHKLNGLKERVRLAKVRASEDYVHATVRALTDDDWLQMEAFAAEIEQRLKPLSELAQNGTPAPLEQLLTAHIAAAEAISAGNSTSPQQLWAGEAGTSLSETLREVLDHAASAPKMSFRDYRDFMSSVLASVPVRRRYPLHPKLKILGLLEARLVQSEVVILGGLNEGIWPGDMDPGAWLSRPQYALARLPMPERRLGLAAHDFVQGLSAEQVYLTWARKSGGTPTVPSRWLLRLRAVLEAAGLKDALKPREGMNWAGWAMGLDWHEDMPAGLKPAPALQPVPVPPPDARPAHYSVTRIGKLIEDPYAVFAEAVLKLKPLETLNTEPGAAERGQFVHKVVEVFSSSHPGPMPADARDLMLAIADDIIADYAPDEALRALWLPQAARMIDWFCEAEAELRQNVISQHTERTATYAVTWAERDITITARADRIDVLRSGGLRIIDYKTGEAKMTRLFKSKDMIAQNAGYKPQLFVEGWLAKKGAFEGIPAGEAEQLMYIRLSGGEPAGEINASPTDPGYILAEEIEATAEGVRNIITGYLQPEQGFPARSGEKAWNRKEDYDHLSRWREWGLGTEAGTDEGGGE